MPEQDLAEDGHHGVVIKFVNDDLVEVTRKPRSDSIPGAGRTHGTH